MTGTEARRTLDGKEHIVNADVLKGKWNEMKGKVKEQWGNLTDDDLDKIEGRSDQMIGLLQQRYGYAREKAEEEYNRFASRFAASGPTRTDKVGTRR
jgi:uncharacterized protein YjbJ (UPF0337 family)